MRSLIEACGGFALCLRLARLRSSRDPWEGGGFVSKNAIHWMNFASWFFGMFWLYFLCSGICSGVFSDKMKEGSEHIGTAQKCLTGLRKFADCRCALKPGAPNEVEIRINNGLKALVSTSSPFSSPQCCTGCPMVVLDMLNISSLSSPCYFMGILF